LSQGRTPCVQLLPQGMQRYLTAVNFQFKYGFIILQWWINLSKLQVAFAGLVDGSLLTGRETFLEKY
jgi:hypothetical protein